MPRKGRPSIRLLVVQNDEDKPLGRIAEALAAEGAEFDVRMPSSDLPAVAAYDGLIVLAGLADPDDDDPAVRRARAAITEALGRAAPVLGICLGGQLLAQVLGGTTYRCREELGYHEVEATEAARDDPLLRDAPQRFTTFHAHVYAFRPPPGAVVLLSNDVCVQACRIGERAWAFQCHPEPTISWVEALARGVRGRTDEVDPRTAAFFRGAGIDPDALEADVRRADETAQRLALGIAHGFAGQCRATLASRTPRRTSSSPLV